jgi:hypothetical protein
MDAKGDTIITASVKEVSNEAKIVCCEVVHWISCQDG